MGLRDYRVANKLEERLRQGGMNDIQTHAAGTDNVSVHFKAPGGNRARLNERTVGSAIILDHSGGLESFIYRAPEILNADQDADALARRLAKHLTRSNIPGPWVVRVKDWEGTLQPHVRYNPEEGPGFPLLHETRSHPNVIAHDEMGTWLTPEEAAQEMLLLDDAYTDLAQP